MNKGKNMALREHRKKQTAAKDKRRAERAATKGASRKQ